MIAFFDCILSTDRMTEIIDNTREKAVIVGARLKGHENFDESIEELANLAAACDIEVAERLVQNISSINSATYIGQGKVDEIRQHADISGANLILFNHELSAKQQRNLERAIELPVLDRTALILDIFHRRAKTKEAKLQVDLAELQYRLPRLAGSYAALGRQRGGQNKGAGEQKIELDRRALQAKIHELEQELAQIEKERLTNRKKRAGTHIPVVALVGYTNAGKSTLMNAFMTLQGSHDDKKVLQKDMLFATLDTSTRRVTLPNKRTILLSDTVGFVSDLPHTLVKAFGSTLEEVVQADILLHIIDVSNSDFEYQIEVTEATLAEIGAHDITRINIFNKSDRLHDDIPFENERGIFVSAKNRIGMDLVAERMCEHLFRDEVICELLVPYTEGTVVNALNEQAFILETHYDAGGTRLVIRCSTSIYERYKHYQFADRQSQENFQTMS